MTIEHGAIIVSPYDMLAVTIGKYWVFWPISHDAKKWLLANIMEDFYWLAGGMVVSDPVHATDMLKSMLLNGLKVGI